MKNVGLKNGEKIIYIYLKKHSKSRQKHLYEGVMCALDYTCT